LRIFCRIPDPQSASWSALAGNLTAGDFSKPPEQHVRKFATILRGCGVAASGSVKVVPHILTAFVGRLAIDTTEDSLHDYLVAAGIQEVRCKKLSSKDPT